MRVNLIFARKWSFTAKDTNRQVEGCELHYARAVPLDSKDAREGREKGARPSTAKGSLALFDQITQVPGQYELELDPRTDNAGNTYMVAVALTPVQPVSVNGSHAHTAVPAGANR